MACGSLVPQPGSEPMSPASEMQNHSHWTTREVITWACLLGEKGWSVSWAATSGMEGVSIVHVCPEPFPFGNKNVLSVWSTAPARSLRSKWGCLPQGPNRCRLWVAGWNTQSKSTWISRGDSDSWVDSLPAPHVTPRCHTSDLGPELWAPSQNWNVCVHGLSKGNALFRGQGTVFRVPQGQECSSHGKGVRVCTTYLCNKAWKSIRKSRHDCRCFSPNGESILPPLCRPLSPFLHQRSRKLPSWASLVSYFRSARRQAIGHKPTTQESALGQILIPCLIHSVARSKDGLIYKRGCQKPTFVCLGWKHPRKWRKWTGWHQEEFATSLGLQLLCLKPSVGGKAPPIPTLPGGNTWSGRMLLLFCLFFNWGTASTLHTVKY